MKVWVLVEGADCMMGAGERVIGVYASLEKASAEEKKHDIGLCYVEEFEVVTE